MNGPIILRFAASAPETVRLMSTAHRRNDPSKRHLLESSMNEVDERVSGHYGWPGLMDAIENEFVATASSRRT